jgi:hypothetical protein
VRVVSTARAPHASVPQTLGPNSAGGRVPRWGGGVLLFWDTLLGRWEERGVFLFGLLFLGSGRGPANLLFLQRCGRRGLSPAQ